MASDVLKSLTVPFKKGEKVVSAGEAGGCMFVVQSGVVRLLRTGEGEGAAVEIGELSKGDFFGESAILEGHSYRFDAVASEDCEIVEISASTFQRMLDANPEIAVRLLRKLSARVDRLEGRLAAGGVPPGEEASPQAAPAVAAAPPEAAEPLKASGARLDTEEGETAFSLGGDEVLVGRYDPVTEIQPEIDLTELDTKRSVSRRHARLSRRKGTWYVSEEVGALNGTFVNGVKLLAGRGAPISDGDTLSFGMVRLVYREG